MVLSQTDTAAVSARVDALTAEGHIILDVDHEAMVRHDNWIPVSTAMAILTKNTDNTSTAVNKEDSTEVFSTKVPADAAGIVLTKVSADAAGIVSTKVPVEDAGIILTEVLLMPLESS